MAKRVAPLFVPIYKLAYYLDWKKMTIIKEYVGKDTCNRNRTFVDVKCQICTNIFTRQKRQLNTEYHCCSAMCLNIAKGNSIELHCDHCGDLFIRAKSKLELSKSGKYFCSRKCKDTAQKYMIEIQPDHYGQITGHTTYREKAFKTYLPLCNRCGYSNKEALEVHHKDRNRENNEISNLEILCANCHTIEHKNKGL